MGKLALFSLLFVAIVAGLLGQQPPALERDGNFTIRFEPRATLLSRTQVPFEITVTDPRNKPVEHAQVKLVIKDRDNMNLRDFRSVMTAPGVYISKPVFSASGEWSVTVEVHRDQELTSRSIQFTVAE